MTIVTSSYRYKPPPKRKGRKLAEITGPAVVTAKESSSRPVAYKAAAEVRVGPPVLAGGHQSNAAQPANDDRKPGFLSKGSAIVTATDRKQGKRLREQQQIPQRIVTFVPKRQQDAWARYLRLTGLTDPDAPQPP